MEGTAFVDSYPDLDGYRQTFPPLPEPVAGVLSRHAEANYQAYQAWKRSQLPKQYRFSSLPPEALKEILESKLSSQKLADRWGVSKATIQRARSKGHKERRYEIPKL